MIGFSQELFTVQEDDGVVQITIFSYSSVENLTLNFTTFDRNATEGSHNFIIYIFFVCLYIYKYT